MARSALRQIQRDAYLITRTAGDSAPLSAVPACSPGDSPAAASPASSSGCSEGSGSDGFKIAAREEALAVLDRQERQRGCRLESRRLKAPADDAATRKHAVPQPARPVHLVIRFGRDVAALTSPDVAADSAAHGTASSIWNVTPKRSLVGVADVRRTSRARRQAGYLDQVTFGGVEVGRRSGSQVIRRTGAGFSRERRTSPIAASAQVLLLLTSTCYQVRRGMRA